VPAGTRGEGVPAGAQEERVLAGTQGGEIRRSGRSDCVPAGRRNEWTDGAGGARAARRHAREPHLQTQLHRLFQAAHSPRCADPPPLVDSLRQLLVLRGVAVAGQSAAIAASLALGVALPVVPMVLVVAALVAVNAALWLRLRHATVTSHREVFLHLALDLAAVTLLLMLAGGPANPFQLLLLVHVVLVALLLPGALAVPMVALVLACFAFIGRWHAPLVMADGGALPGSLQSIGRWMSFVLTAVVAAWFVARISATLREHERLLGVAAQKAANDETVVRIGALAAGAAHELATPLTTIAILVDEIRQDAADPGVRRDAEVIATQVGACRQTLGNLTAAARHARVAGEREPVDRYLEGIAAHCRAIRPDLLLTHCWQGDMPVPLIAPDPALRQAIMILLNNAADASPAEVEMSGHWDVESVRVTIADRGAGVPTGALEKLGHVFFTTKLPGQGTGLGGLLAATTVRQLGGTLRWSNRPGGGTRVDLVLPLPPLVKISGD
jgi:two-component system sensor histidine kinase RegB